MRPSGTSKPDSSPQEAADRALAEFDEVTGSTAGLIVLDSEGRAGSAYNSAAMQTSAGP